MSVDSTFKEHEGGIKVCLYAFDKSSLGNRHIMGHLKGVSKYVVTEKMRSLLGYLQTF